MLRAGDQVDPRIRRQFGVLRAARIGVHERGALLPVFGRGVGLDDQWVARLAVEDRAGLAGKRIGRGGIAERKPVLRIQPVLMLCRGAAWHAKAMVGEHFAGAGDMAEHTVEHAPARAVAVHPEFEEMAQEAAALRYAEADRMPDLGIVGRQRIAVPLVTQKRYEVAHRGEADTEHLRLGRPVPQFVNLEWLERAPLRQQPDRAVVDEFPLASRDVAPPVALPVAHREPRRGLVERGRGIAQPPDNQFGRTARPGLELVANAAGDRLTVFQRHREIGAEPVIGARRAGIPARPHDRMAAPEEKAEPGVARRLRIVDRDRIIRRHIVDELQNAFAAAVGHVIDEHPAAASRLGRSQDEKVSRVFDLARFIACRLVEIDDARILRRAGIEHALRDAAHPHIAAGLAERLSLGKRLDGGDVDFDDGHPAAPRSSSHPTVKPSSRRKPGSISRAHERLKSGSRPSPGRRR